MEVGAFGLGGNNIVNMTDIDSKASTVNSNNGFWGNFDSTNIYSGVTLAYSPDWFTQIRGSGDKLEFSKLCLGYYVFFRGIM